MARAADPPRVLVLEGVPAAPGIGIGVAAVLRREEPVVPEYTVAADAVAAEVERLERAVAAAAQQLERIRAPLASVEIVDAILRTQIMILEDRQLLEDTTRRIRSERINAEWAVEQELRRLDRLFASMEDAYLRERRADLRYAARRLLQNLLGHEPERLGELRGPAVVIASDLSPAEIGQIDRRRVVAFVTEAGGRTSHAAIVATSLGLPAVVGVDGATTRVRDGESVIVDGAAGRVVLHPDALTIQGYRGRIRSEAAQEREWLRRADLPAETRDGRPIQMLANIERAEELSHIRSYGARGVGLFRTEFLYLNRARAPDEEEQLGHYRAVLEAVAPDAAVIRTLDLGADKLPCSVSRRAEMNPALGLRGIRVSLGDRALLRLQLRAMLRASAHGRLRILLPMVASVEEVRATREALEEARAELEREGRAVGSDVALGAMVETPAAVAIADVLAREADFLSIGTNDLIQYMLAVDRENESVAYLYNALHPAVLRAIRDCVLAAHRADRSVAVCGEMASDPVSSLVLLGLGVDGLSMQAAAIPRVKAVLRATTQADARALARRLVELSSGAEVAECLRKATSATLDRARWPA
jgi:phosphotransferase system enzyme I (PtsI)